MIYLIQYAKSQNIRNAGEWAESALESAKSDPEITTSAFMKARMVRNRNRRIAGKFLFQNWARAVGIKIPTETGEMEMYMRRHSLVVSRYHKPHSRHDGPAWDHHGLTLAAICKNASYRVFISFAGK